MENQNCDWCKREFQEGTIYAVLDGTEKIAHYNPLCKSWEGKLDCSGHHEIYKRGGREQVIQHGGSWTLNPSVLINGKLNELQIGDIAIYDKYDKKIMGRVFDSRLGMRVGFHSKEYEFNTQPCLWVHIEEDNSLTGAPQLRVSTRSMKHLKKFNRDCEKRFEDLKKL